MLHFFTAPDGTTLAYRLVGEGPPLVCLPGGPMLDAGYLGDLGGLTADRQLVLPDPRGTGASATPDDPLSYRCNRQVPDVEALRHHLGVHRMDLLGHSAGANLVYRYLQAHPDRVSRVLLITPSPFGVGIDITDEQRMATAQARACESWYPEAAAAYARVRDGSADAADWTAMTPFSFGRWDDQAMAYDAWMNDRRNTDAAQAFSSGDAFDPAAVRSALAALEVPVVVLAGEVDLGNPPSAMAELAALFPVAEFVVQPGAGHFPWLDDPVAFRHLLGPFLA